eukprot:gb/GECG01008167.1/.p1 GENE.gb/GECG01008167.1/~~gb/GECG01008167.1/.p1  ORF type:complete len:361 (+),score=29.53 gb/GECG01008167.1/:1-1083(+)
MATAVDANTGFESRKQEFAAASSNPHYWIAPYSDRDKALRDAVLKPMTTSGASGTPTKTSSMAWNNDSSLLATARADYVVGTWKWDENGAPKAFLNLKGHQDRVNTVAWNPEDSQLCASASADGSIRIWDLRTRRCKAQAQNTKMDNLHMSWSQDRPYIAITTRENHIVILDTRTWKPFKDCTLPEEPQVNQLQFRTGDELYVSLGYRGLIQRGCTSVYNVDKPSDTLERCKSAQMHAGLQATLRFTHDLQYFITSGSDGIVNFCDADSLVALRTYEKPEGNVWAADVSNDGHYIAYSQLGSLAELIRTSDGASLRKFPDTQECQSIAWSTKGTMLTVSAESSSTDSSGKIHLLKVSENQ